MFDDIIQKKYKIVIKKFPIEMSNEESEKEKRARRVKKLIKHYKSLGY